MICPLYRLAQSNPQDPYLILNDRTISFDELHRQVCACEIALLAYSKTIPLAIDSANSYDLMSWLMAAARLGNLTPAFDSMRQMQKLFGSTWRMDVCP